MLSGSERQHQHRHSLHLPRLASASEILSLRSPIPELEGLPAFFLEGSPCFVFFSLAFLLRGALLLTISHELLRFVSFFAVHDFAHCARKHLTSGISQCYTNTEADASGSQSMIAHWNTVENDIVSLSACTTARHGNKQTKRKYISPVTVRSKTKTRRHSVCRFYYFSKL